MFHIAPILIAILIASLAGLYKIFEKAGEKGWKALVPVYNFYIWLKILKKPWWWIFILLIPGVGFMMTMIMAGITSLNMEKKKEVDITSALVAIPVEIFIFFTLLPSIKTSAISALGTLVVGYITYGTIKILLALLSKDKADKADGETIRMIVMGIFFFISLPFYGFSKLKFSLSIIDKSQRTVGKEWTEAIAFAVIAATIIRTFFLEAYTIPTSSMEKSLMIGDFLFVSKADYGARIPMTPISFPFAHNSLPGTLNTPSYLQWLSYPYSRLPGFTHVKRHDIVVFNFPEGDTICTNPGMDNPGYYAYCREINDMGKNGRDYVLGNNPVPTADGAKQPGPILVRPIDKEENYIKRCIGTPGDTLLIRHAQVYINGKADDVPAESQYAYDVTTRSGDQLGRLLTEKLDETEQVLQTPQPNTYQYILTRAGAEEVRKSPDVVSVVPHIMDSGSYDPSIFPFNSHYKWNVDYFGPLYIPKEGATIKLDTSNLHIYRRIITAYEHNTLDIKGKDIYINGQLANRYTFKMNYYFMMGDNRHRSADSRYWGFVPYDHVVGKASFIWMSLKDNVPFLKKFRVKRFFTFINTEGLSPSYFIYFVVILAIALVYFFIRGSRKQSKE